jgi:hypothetical protein
VRAAEVIAARSLSPRGAGIREQIVSGCVYTFLTGYSQARRGLERQTQIGHIF